MHPLLRVDSSAPIPLLSPPGPGQRKADLELTRLLKCMARMGNS